MNAPPPPARADAGQTALRLDDVEVTFDGEVTALKHLDLTVRTGEFLTLLGASGTGKSTILRLMAGLLAPTSGTIERDADISRRGGTAMVFQDAALMDWASVRDNVWLPLRFAGVSRRDATPEIDAALETVGLSNRADALPKELSGGMAMRVSIARALVTRPRLLLLDEPFGALDEMTRFRLNDEILDLWQTRGLTVVLVTHSVFEAAFMSQRVAILSGSPANVSTTIDLPDVVRDATYRESAEYLNVARKLSQTLANP
ncbi:ABC transporter ATP-binding protein [Tepidamorphus sp. 3E244]|uniref:ABC transporter ATP-binding protein n=1 Tax=Tepidamorphus sp. 3E244 TaxID=3385498 RepID=UPI0038FC5224